MPTTIAELIWIITVGAVGIVIYFLKDMKKDISNVTKEQSEIKINYLNKFAEVKLNIGESEKNIISEISGLKVHLAENFVTKNECKFIQEKEH